MNPFVSPCYNPSPKSQNPPLPRNPVESPATAPAVPHIPGPHREKPNFFFTRPDYKLTPTSSPLTTPILDAPALRLQIDAHVQSLDHSHTGHPRVCCVRLANLLPSALAGQRPKRIDAHAAARAEPAACAAARLQPTFGRRRTTTRLQPTLPETTLAARGRRRGSLLRLQPSERNENVDGTVALGGGRECS